MSYFGRVQDPRWLGSKLKKPRADTCELRLDLSHPLAKRLAVFLPFVEGGGRPRFFSDPSKLVTLQTGARWTRGQLGFAMQGDGTNGICEGPDDYRPIEGSDSASLGTGDFTMMVIDNTAANATRGNLFGQIQGTTRGIGLVANATNQATSSSGNWCIFLRPTTGAFAMSTSSIGGTVDGRVHCRAARRWAGAPGNTFSIWQDGVQLASGTRNEDFYSYNSIVNVCIGSQGTPTSQPLQAGQSIFLCAAWNRALTNWEMQNLPQLIWQLLVPVHDFGLPVYFADAAGTLVANNLDIRWNLAQLAAQNLDIRWNLAQFIGQNLDIRWNLAQFVAQNLDIRWNIAEFVSQNIDLRWDIAGLVAQNLDIRWNLAALIANNLDLRWNIAQLIAQNLDIRWDIAGSVGANLDLRWHIFNNVANNLDLRWNLSQLIAQNVDLRWDINGVVGNNVDLRWDLAGVVSNNLDVRWHVLNLVAQNLDLRWNLAQNVGNNIDLRWNIANFVFNDIDLKWNLSSFVNQSLDIRWNLYNLIANNLDIRWDLSGAVGNTLNIQWDIAGPPNAIVLPLKGLNDMPGLKGLNDMPGLKGLYQNPGLKGLV